MGKFIRNTIVYSVAAVVSVVVGWWLSQREKEAANLQPTHSPSRMPPSTMETEETKIVLPPEAFENLEEVSIAKPPAKSKASSPAKALDDLTTIKGIGPKTADSLAKIGITSFAQLASADAQDIKNRLEGTALSLKKIEDWIQTAKELQNP
jgi:predicted flap endonuclease-1-like 5' DNA nuclease